MAWILIIVLLILWLAGIALDVDGGLIHLLIIAAAIILILELLYYRPRST
jgi:hypothetical protein